MAYESWQPLFAGLFLLLAGGIHMVAPYQAARKAAMKEGNEDSVADEWEVDATQIFGVTTALVGLSILLSSIWLW